MLRSKKFDFDTIVVGSGAGGSIAAHLLAGAGHKVAVVEEGQLGGDSLNYSEIPKMSLMESLRRFSDSKDNHEFGVRTPTAMYNYPSVRARLLEVKERIMPLKTAFIGEGITVLKGSLRFTGKHEVQVEEDFYTAENFIIASGSRPNLPDIEGIEEAETHNRRNILDLKAPPRSLAIIGSDSTAVEYANFFQTLGSKVTIFTTEPQLLPTCDSDVSNFVTSRLKQKGVDVQTSTEVTKLFRQRARTEVSYMQGPNDKSDKFDEVMISCGDLPVLNLGLESAKVSYNPSGVRVNQFMQTSNHNVYAVGDCIEVNTPHHLTCEQARVAVSNLLNDKKKTRTAVESVAPSIISIDPEIALVGVSEYEAANDNIKVKVYKAFVVGNDLGFVKLVCLPSGQIVGAAIIAPAAREMSLPLVMAINLGLSTTELAQSLVPFGAYSEAIRQACLAKPRASK
jgi:mercuric reductase